MAGQPSGTGLLKFLGRGRTARAGEREEAGVGRDPMVREAGAPDARPPTGIGEKAISPELAGSRTVPGVVGPVCFRPIRHDVALEPPTA
jgi:hypothetical protein